MLATDTDWYQIVVPSGASVRAETIEGDIAETCESNGIDSGLALFNASGTQLTIDDDSGRGFCSLIDGTGGAPVKLAAHALPAGTYFLRVQSHDTSGNVSNLFTYRLVVDIRY